jgi:DNA-binding CsgD family transcriptional regulator
VTVWPVPCDRAWQGLGCAVAVAKPEEGRRRLSEEMVASVYGLTAAEAAVAVALARGEDVREIARRRGVSTETVRGQLKAVLAKTGCSRQADLVRMLLAGPAGWPDPRV